ncbi:hypothetical protein JD502_06280 [Aeromonas veronii]|uniref:hypothetical protein n=1 Tax=Aeromonas veronii TaxID=654 RepID=UPI00191F8875|nr:hypothetical protein [Aeromonas veronii]MBL0642564.1 hypothetical protein [Aeromonas veronii]
MATPISSLPDATDLQKILNGGISDAEYQVGENSEELADVKLFESLWYRVIQRYDLR